MSTGEAAPGGRRHAFGAINSSTRTHKQGLRDADSRECGKVYTARCFTGIADVDDLSMTTPPKRDAGYYVDMTQGISRRWPKEWAGLAVSVTAVAIAAGVGGVAAAGAAETFARLQQPAWAPPASLFGPTWTLLYALMAVSAWLVWRSHPSQENRVPLAVYGVQLVLNTAWTPLFFGLGWRGTAFIEILVLWAFIAATVLLFWQRSRWAAILLLPYVAWTTYAVVLNFSVWQLNS